MIKLGYYFIFCFLMQGCFGKENKKQDDKDLKDSPYRWTNSKAGKKICVEVSEKSKTKKMMPLAKCINLGVGEYDWVKNDFGVKSCVYSVDGGISNPMPTSLCEKYVSGWLGWVLGH